MNCNGDFCDVSDIVFGAVNMEIEAKRKVDKWLRELQPIDYDAPGTSVREQGV